MKVLYFDCGMGAAGDMLMASLLDIYEDKDGFISKMNSLINGVEIKLQTVKKSGITGMNVSVMIDGEEENVVDVELEVDHVHEQGEHDIHEHNHSHEHDHEHSHSHVHDYKHNHEHGHNHSHEHIYNYSHNHHSLEDIKNIINRFDLPIEVKERANNVYQLIATAESKVHGEPVGEIHFHEVGAMDAVIDIVGVCYLLHLINPGRVLASSVNLGSGMVKAAHGILPVPAPATAEIVKGMPTYMSDIKAELLTPTGAALLKTFVDDYVPMPMMNISNIGYGMGKKELSELNAVRVFVGDCNILPGYHTDKDTTVELIADIDDMSSEELGFAIEILREKGALEVHTVPVYMKKNRPAYELVCLCDMIDEEKFSKLILENTTTFGVRSRKCRRHKLNVEFQKIDTPYGMVRKKIGTGWGIVKSKYEYDDIYSMAKQWNMSYNAILKIVQKEDKN